MSRELYCPKCDSEYWGDVEKWTAKCECCDYIFKEKEIKEALGWEVNNE